MNILKTTTASTKWARTVRILVVYLAGAAALGISAFSLELAAENATDLKPFAGTWECKYKGQDFFTLRMAVKDGVLGGTSVHSVRVGWVDGELIPGTDETAQDRIFDTCLGARIIAQNCGSATQNDMASITVRFTWAASANCSRGMRLSSCCVFPNPQFICLASSVTADSAQTVARKGHFSESSVGIDSPLGGAANATT